MGNHNYDYINNHNENNNTYNKLNNDSKIKNYELFHFIIILFSIILLLQLSIFLFFISKVIFVRFKRRKLEIKMGELRSILKDDELKKNNLLTH